MAGSTGSPLNLNLLDGADDVVKALTDYFNQNMNNINKSDAHVKVWMPNTAYQKYDIVAHPYHNSLLYATSAHTSSNSTTEADWSTNDGSKWLNLSYAPAIANWMANMNYNVGDLLMDGFELKRATTSGSTSTLDRTRSSLVSSRVASWTPNTKYNVGDLVFIKRLNGNQPNKGDIMNGFFRCQLSHVSNTIFPASTDNIWFPINDDAITYMVNINQGNGLMGNYLRKGRRVEVSNSSPTSSAIRMSTSWGTMASAGTIPVQFRPTLGVDAISNINDYNNIFIRRFQKDGSILVKQSWGSPSDTGSSVYLTESGANWFTDAEPYWEAGVPAT